MTSVALAAMLAVSHLSWAFGRWVGFGGSAVPATVMVPGTVMMSLAERGFGTAS
jgi:hypothetical protein